MEDDFKMHGNYAITNLGLKEMKAVTLTNNNNEKRRELDFYPTPPEVTHALMRFLKLKPHSVIWEPACGNGAMVDVLCEYGFPEDYVIDKNCQLGNKGHRIIASDIRETSHCKQPLDFLKAEPISGLDAIITNPPFNQSEDFIRHALSMSPIVAMVLKSQYWHAKKRTNLFEENPPAYVLPLSWRPDFLFDVRKPGEKANPTMEVNWTVWIKGDTNTKYRILGRSA